MPIGVNPIAVPLVNGTAWSFARLRIEVAGFKLNGGIKSAKYKRERKRDQVRSNHVDPVAQTDGENSYSGSIEVYAAWWLNLMRTVRTTLGQGYGDVAFNAFISYGPSALDPFQDVLVGCHFDSTDADNSQGTAALVRTIDLQPLKILFDGVDDCEVSLQQLVA
jgi:hypothetical protein